LAGFLDAFGVQFQYTWLHPWQVFVSALNARGIEVTRKIEFKKRKIRWIYIVLGIILIITFILGLLKFMGNV